MGHPSIPSNDAVKANVGHPPFTSDADMELMSYIGKLLGSG
jgi:hypothetical protein